MSQSAPQQPQGQGATTPSQPAGASEPSGSAAHGEATTQGSSAAHGGSTEPRPSGAAPGELVPAASRTLQPRPQPQRPWTSQDYVWWNTAQVLTAVRAGFKPNPVSPVVDPIRPTHSGEVILGSCDGEILAFKRGDNSSYQPLRGFFLAGGAAGLALMAAFFGGQAVVNSRRKRRAERDAVEKWRHLANARLSVSTHGIYLGTSDGVMFIGYQQIRECQVTGVGEVMLAATNEQGNVRLKLRGQWAELVMVIWAALFLPEHPQLVGRSWLPGDWLLHARAYNREVDTSNWP